jgi:hypothetical protein
MLTLPVSNSPWFSGHGLIFPLDYWQYVNWRELAMKPVVISSLVSSALSCILYAANTLSSNCIYHFCEIMMPLSVLRLTRQHTSQLVTLLKPEKILVRRS